MKSDELPRCLRLPLLTGSPAIGAVLLLLVSVVIARTKSAYRCELCT